MRGLIYYELIKLNNKKLFLGLLIICLIVNGINSLYIVHEVNDDGYSMVDLSQKYQGYENESVNSDILEQEIIKEHEKGTDASNIKELRMTEVIYSRYVELEGYSEYLNTISEQAEKRLKSSLFSRPDTFTHKNLLKTSEVYERLHGCSVNADFDGGVQLLVENGITDFLLLTMMFFLVMQIFLSEREQGTWEMNKCMKLGHLELMIAKIITMVCFVVGITLLLYGTNYLIALSSVGFGDVNRSIQSMEGYMNSPLLISVGQYIIVFLLAKIIVTIAISCWFSALCMMVKNSVFAGVFGILIYAAEYILTFLKSEALYWGVLKEFNLATLNDIKGYFADYYNFNLASYPVSHFVCGCVMIVFLTLSGCLLILWLIENEQMVKVESNSLSQLVKRVIKSGKVQNDNAKNQRLNSHRGILFFEWYKIYVINKGWVILFLFVCVQICVFINQTWFIDTNEFYYREYSKQLEGALSEGHWTYVQSEALYFESMDKEQQLIEHAYESGEIDWRQREYYLEKLMDKSDRESAFQRVKKQYEELICCEAEGLSVEYIYRTPWELLFGKEGTIRAIIYMSEIFLVLILLFSSCGSIEKDGMELLIQASTIGHKTVLRYKTYVCIVTAVIVYLCTYLPEMAGVLSTFGIGNLDAPVSSFLYRDSIGCVMSLGGYMIFRMGIRLLIVISAGLLLLHISQKLRDRIKTILIGTAVLLIPTIIVAGVYMM